MDPSPHQLQARFLIVSNTNYSARPFIYIIAFNLPNQPYVSLAPFHRKNTEAQKGDIKVT